MFLSQQARDLDQTNGPHHVPEWVWQHNVGYQEVSAYKHRQQNMIIPVPVDSGTESDEKTASTTNGVVAKEEAICEDDPIEHLLGYL